MWGDLKIPFIMLVLFIIMMIFSAFMASEQSDLCRQKGGEWIRNFGCVKVERIL